LDINRFPGDVASKRCLGSAPMLPFGDFTAGKTETMGLSDLMILLLTWGVTTANRSKEQLKKNTQNN
jgi:hypothetical protein